MTDADAVFNALADATRRQVVRALAESGPSTATELSGAFTVSRQAVVKHLQALNQAGLVAGEREGREVRYHLTPAPMSGAMDWMAEVGAGWDDRLAALKRHLSD